MQSMGCLRIAIFPDVLAHYRVPVFKNLARINGLSLSVFAPRKTKIPNLKLAEGVGGQTNLLVESNQNIEIGRVCLWQTKQIKAVLSSKYDIVILWGMCHVLSSWLALLAGRLKGKRVLLWSHGLYGREGTLLKYVRYLYYRLADGLILYGGYSRSLLTRMGYPAHRIWVINNSLDVYKQVAVRQGMAEAESQSFRKATFDSITKDTFIGIFVGRLTSAKKLDIVPEIIANLRRDNFDFRFLFVGDGPAKSAIETQVKKFGQEANIRFLGAEYDEERTARYFLASDLCVSPGDVGLTSMHAMIFGVPVATNSNMRHQMPEAEAIVEPASGFVFDPDRPGGFEEAFKQWYPYYKADPASVRGFCERMIEKWYSPEYQLDVFQKCLRCEPQKEEGVKALPAWI